MDFAFTPEEEELRKLAQKASAGKDALLEAQRAGLMGATVAVEHGGAGLSFVELCIILEQLGRAARPQYLDAALLGALAVSRFATPEQKRRYLPDAAGGEALLILAIDPLLTVEREGAGFRLSGVLDAVPLVDRAARLVVATPTSLLLVDPRLAAREKQVPTDESAVEQLRFDRTLVPEGEALPPAPLAYLAERQSVALCAIELGVAAAQLQMTAEHVMRRQQFGKPIGLFQAVAQRAADMWVDVEAMRLVTWHAAWLLAQDRACTRECHAAAFFAAEAGQRVANAAQHLHAGIGFDRGYPLYRYFLAAKQIELSLGGANRRLAQLGAIFGGAA